MLKHKDGLNSLDRLEQWFRSMCNGDWEHTYGIKILTLDNPGWIVAIELRDTPLFGCRSRRFAKTTQSRIGFSVKSLKEIFAELAA